MSNPDVLLPLDLQNCQDQLQLTRQYQKNLARILARIRNAVPLEKLSSSSCQDICSQLQIERVAVYRFNEDWSGRFINELGFAKSPWDELDAFGDNPVWQDSHLQETKGGRYISNEPFSVADIYEAGHSRCHVELLEQFSDSCLCDRTYFCRFNPMGLDGRVSTFQPAPMARS